MLGAQARPSRPGSFFAVRLDSLSLGCRASVVQSGLPLLAWEREPDYAEDKSRLEVPDAFPSSLLLLSSANSMAHGCNHLSRFYAFAHRASPVSSPETGSTLRSPAAAHKSEAVCWRVNP